MTYNTEKLRTRIVEIVFFVIGVILLLLLGAIASGQTKTEAMKVAKGHSQVQQPLYKDYRPAAALQGLSRCASWHDGSGDESETWRAGDEER
jgi:hypothetical protein